MEESNVTVENKTKYYEGKTTLAQQRCNGVDNLVESSWKKQFVETRTKRSRPGWAVAIANGRNATNEYSRSGYDLKVMTGAYTITITKQCSTQDKTLTQQWRGVHSAGTIPTSLTLPSISYGATQLCRSRFLASIKRAQTHISGPTFIGELRESIAMIRKPAKFLARNIDEYLAACAAIRRLNRRLITRDILNKDLHSLWLEYSLGWAPLISETKKGAEALSRLINGDRKTFQVSGSATDKTKQTTITKSAISTLADIIEVRSFTTEAGMVLRGAVRPKASGPVWRAMDLFGFNASEFVPTIWELLPMSFVVDYFVNVGDILSATYTDTTGLYWSSESRRMKAISSVLGNQIVIRPNLPYANVTGDAGGWNLERYKFSRSLPTSLMPTLACSLPGTATQLLNLAGLAANVKQVSTSLSSLLTRH